MCTLVTIHCLSDASMYSESFSLLLYRRYPTRRSRITLLSTPHTVNYGSRIAEISFALQLTCSATISDFRTCSCVFVYVTFLPIASWWLCRHRCYSASGIWRKYSRCSIVSVAVLAQTFLAFSDSAPRSLHYGTHEPFHVPPR
jgi:hypothetical protein